MSTLLIGLVAGAVGGGVVAGSREAVRYLCRQARRLGHRRQHRATVRSDAPSAAAVHSSDARAAYRAVQVRAYADNLARGDVRLREQLRRFEKPINGSEHQSGDVPW